MKYFIATALLVVTAVAAPMASAAVLEATFKEEHSVFGGIDGASNNNTDTGTDFFTLDLTGAGSFTIKSAKFNFDQSQSIGIYLDIENNPNGNGSAGDNSAFPLVDLNANIASNDAAEGATSLMLTFDPGTTSVSFSVDVDNGNAVIRGSNGNGGNSDMVGTTIDVVVGNDSFMQTVSFAYTTDNGDPDNTAKGSVEFQPVPEPSSIAVWSALGLGAIGFGRWRRRKKA